MPPAYSSEQLNYLCPPLHQARLFIVRFMTTNTWLWIKASLILSSQLIYWSNPISKQLKYFGTGVKVLFVQLQHYSKSTRKNFFQSKTSFWKFMKLNSNIFLIHMLICNLMDSQWRAKSVTTVFVSAPLLSAYLATRHWIPSNELTTMLPTPS